MIVKGVRTTREQVEIDVSSNELIDIVRKKINQKYPSQKQIAYIENGVVFKYDFTNGHTGDDEHSELREATEEDLKFDEFLKLLGEVLK